MAIAYQRIFRIILSTWLFLGHGTPKVLHWFFGIETWGPHFQFIPKNSFSALAALIEFLCPFMIIIGCKIKWNALAISAMLFLSAFALPFPWLHIKIPIEGYSVPFAIILSKEISIIYSLAYLSLLFFAEDEIRFKTKT